MIARDMATLYAEIVASKTGIHPKVLTLAADIVRMLHGARLTCCKVHVARYTAIEP